MTSPGDLSALLKSLHTPPSATSYFSTASHLYRQDKGAREAELPVHEDHAHSAARHLLSMSI
ncbi:hypothetical protein CBOM_01113 [Ceraceosorus bombacis]|uniref:Uncharacterized protein n=1 Tax=Ceraceosorus bombacis TaxID=401625 RepID=A0A0P1BBS3_9BASI|nr:hypothetical protein CBOM_01113 [Ceraceosorus bombacis]